MCGRFCVRVPLGNCLLSWSWAAYVGRISYGLYLWHWPVIVLLEMTLGPRPVLAVFLTLARPRPDGGISRFVSDSTLRYPVLFGRRRVF